MEDLQNVANDANAPHVRRRWNPLEIDYFRRDKFGCSKHHFLLHVGVVATGQAKVDQFHAVSALRDTENVFRLLKSKPNQGHWDQSYTQNVN